MADRSSTQRPLTFSRGAQPVLSVSELTSRLRSVIEREVGTVRVEGELSDFTRAASGHCYFTLKDDEAQMRCVMWRWQANDLTFSPSEGMLLHAEGTMSLYEKRGDVQLQVESMTLAGEGALRKAFEKLKRKLDGEGLFDDAHKQALPAFPTTIGVVTSGDGAALHDITSTLERRFPAVEVQLCPVNVQGAQAGTQIAEAIRFFNARQAQADPPVSVLIVGRGGGSTEDLWAFNEEVVARAIFDSEIPVVSAVGHETDISIADLVADKRAATPTMAAEVVVPHRRELAEQIRQLRRTLRHCLLQLLRDSQQELDHLTTAYGFQRPARLADTARQRLADRRKRLHQAAQRSLRRRQEQLRALTQRLHLLDPRRPLSKGYVKVERNETPVARADELASGDQVRLRFQDGDHTARIEA